MTGRFFYVDERFPDGALKGGAIDSEAHADFYVQLAAGDGGVVPWHATFVKDKGYVRFQSGSSQAAIVRGAE